MAKRQRRPIDEGKFEDPLKNYDVSAHGDAFVTGLAEHDMNEIETTPFRTELPTATVGEVFRSWPTRTSAAS